MPESPTIDTVSLRDAMSRYATGVVVLTVGGEHVNAMTANAFTSLSLDPPQVLACVARTATMHRSITAAGTFGVSLLSADQQDVARRFADSSRPRGADLFAAVPVRVGAATGVPLLEGASAWLECELAHDHEGGTHSIFVGRVLAAGLGPVGVDAMVYAGGKFHRATA
ncbi:flavin reductase family protein [Saccharothrix violaceirubra]|uniref:Flavin reductase (DIM6/NTAB) family NADH-FMN oxidoreductase RutF n=1 Tax=Saccharothrix violaceirubra TaxID=413306 RepID=A0A7W7WX71_9PSEU|nr:flavin reductase family protein [Saccharothrix violaceirubra]MBB4966318.1 flavin reductase (DIM6/NTAB) family NADH-FMN oxidoreductase RutF [Saccharothrix violaceirubra]